MNGFDKKKFLVLYIKDVFGGWGKLDHNEKINRKP